MRIIITLYKDFAAGLVYSQDPPDMCVGLCDI